MKRMRLVGMVFAVACMALAQHPGMHPPVAGAPKVELKGKISRIEISMGQGMPRLEVRSGDKTTWVWLGSMRYLMEQDFKPRAGDEVTVLGYRSPDGVVAISVTTRGKTLRLRDEEGFPLWMKGRRGPGMKTGS